MPLKNRFKSAWNAFNNRAPTPSYNNGALTDVSMVSYNPSRTITRNSADKSIVTSIINRIAVDVSQTSIRHVRLDENGRYLEDIKSGLNECLTVEANIDQSHTDSSETLLLVSVMKVRLRLCRLTQMTMSLIAIRSIFTLFVLQELQHGDQELSKWNAITT